MNFEISGSFSPNAVAWHAYADNPFMPYMVMYLTPLTSAPYKAWFSKTPTVLPKIIS